MRRGQKCPLHHKTNSTNFAQLTGNGGELAAMTMKSSEFGVRSEDEDDLLSVGSDSGVKSQNDSNGTPPETEENNIPTIGASETRVRIGEIGNCCSTMFRVFMIFLCFSRQ